MTDLRDRFRALDTLRSPDLWHEIEARALAAKPAGGLPAPWLLVAVLVLVALAIGGAAMIGSGVVRLPVAPDAIPAPSSAAIATPDLREAPAWIATGDMVTPRSGGHSVTLLGDGRILVAGGAGGDETIAGLESMASAELFDPASLTWASTGDMIEARSGHTALLLRDGSVLVAGGGDPNGSGGGRSAELYDPATGNWTPTDGMTQARAGHTATLLPGGTVLVAGGNGGGGPFRDSAELYDPASGTWSPTGDMIQGRANHSAILLRDGTVLVAGGVFGNDRGPCCGPLSSAELYDPRTGSWTSTASMIELQGGQSATLLRDGRVLVVGEINGGIDSGASPPELYDPRTETWTRTLNMVELRSEFTAELLGDGRVLVAGGDTDQGRGVVATVELYDPRTESWIPAERMIAPRRWGQVAIRLADGRVLVVGGAMSADGRDVPVVLSSPSAEIFDPDRGG